MKRFDFVIIGEGIAGLYAAFLLTKTYPQKKIALVSDSSQLPPCSYRTTGVVSESGISLGVSELGDLLHHAHSAFLEHVKSDSPDGVYSGIRYHLSSDGCGPFIKRWPLHAKQSLPMIKREMFVATEDCFIIDPNEYLSYLRKHAQFEFINDRVIEIDQHKILGSKLYLEGEHIFLMNGAFQRSTPIKMNLNPQDEFYLKGCRVVPGHFALFHLMNLGEENFVLSHGHCNLIYRAWSQEVLIGGTTNKHESLDDRGELEEMIHFYQDLCSFPLEKPTLIDTGLRMKGMKRTPRMVEINSYTHALWGSYKNGWSLPHYFMDRYIKEFKNV